MPEVNLLFTPEKIWSVVHDPLMFVFSMKMFQGNIFLLK